MSRTKLQTDANKLDLEIYRLIGNMNEFEQNVRGHLNWLEINSIKDSVLMLHSVRIAVRHAMHPDDVERTKG